ncbi:hypothetical protein K493DRAFT_315076 [Basidiobolus meristosporus CBS 931.73]|uniref:Transmembrane protein 230 n=1 Tax=Basidiobolus meristosporus CBS 931.73 TaxID=1314790 RepID=A0A1Y1YB40_9FUNG|nr:hypothetical protein K493DRAFT_315076 [Basidiobolus meristosporus CBS 931.73]|eukprot:ORX95261.1 hypothetical protein K493DRAFT_315076 [Basidiobolus meristosporus CBS 931.73]
MDQRPSNSTGVEPLSKHEYQELIDNPSGFDVAIVPCGSVILTVIFFVFGIMGIFLGAAEFFSYVPSEGWGSFLLIFGALLFIPGLYYARRVWHAMKGYRRQQSQLEMAML